MFLKLATHLVTGRVDPEVVDPRWFGQPRQVDLASVLDRALDEAGVAPTLQELAPHHPQYGQLKQTLARYREIEKRGGWPTTLTARLQLAPGTRDAAVAPLRQRLAASGELPSAAVSGDTVDAELR